MTATDTSRDNDRVECISEGHLQFMREYIRHEEETAKATLDRFLRERFKPLIGSAQATRPVLF